MKKIILHTFLTLSLANPLFGAKDIYKIKLMKHDPPKLFSENLKSQTKLYNDYLKFQNTDRQNSHIGLYVSLFVAGTIGVGMAQYYYGEHKVKKAYERDISIAESFDKIEENGKTKIQNMSTDELLFELFVHQFTGPGGVSTNILRLHFKCYKRYPLTEAILWNELLSNHRDQLEEYIDLINNDNFFEDPQEEGDLCSEWQDEGGENIYYEKWRRKCPLRSAMLSAIYLLSDEVTVNQRRILVIKSQEPKKLIELRKGHGCLIAPFNISKHYDDHPLRANDD